MGASVGVIVAAVLVIVFSIKAVVGGGGEATASPIRSPR